MPASPCLEAGCGNVSAYRGRCAVHSKDREQETHRTGRLEPNSGRMYGKRRWTMLRRRRLFIEPLCRSCGIVATDVDHVIPIEDGGAPWDIENTRSLCHACHSRRTRQTQLGGEHARSTH